MSVLPMFWCLVALAIGPGIYEHGFAENKDVILLFSGWFLGTLLGVIMYHSAIDAEEREKEDNTFKNNVYGFYTGMLSTRSAEDSVNETAIQYDISPSGVRNIVRIYEK